MQFRSVSRLSRNWFRSPDPVFIITRCVTRRRLVDWFGAGQPFAWVLFYRGQRSPDPLNHDERGSERKAGKGSAELFGSETNYSVVLSRCREMNPIEVSVRKRCARSATGSLPVLDHGKCLSDGLDRDGQGTPTVAVPPPETPTAGRSLAKAYHSVAAKTASRSAGRRRGISQLPE
jgi:hypothetical protein